MFQRICGFGALLLYESFLMSAEKWCNNQCRTRGIRELNDLLYTYPSHTQTENSNSTNPLAPRPFRCKRNATHSHSHRSFVTAEPIKPASNAMSAEYDLYKGNNPPIFTRRRKRYFLKQHKDDRAARKAFYDLASTPCPHPRYSCHRQPNSLFVPRPNTNYSVKIIPYSTDTSAPDNNPSSLDS